MGDSDNDSSIFKTPAKLILSNSDDEEDLSTIIPTKPSPSTHLPSFENIENPQLTVQKKRKLQLVADPDEAPETLIPSKSRSASSASSGSKRVPSLSLISKPTLSPPEPNKSYKTFEESTPEIRQISTPLHINDSNLSPSKPAKASQLSNQHSTPQSIVELRRAETKIDSELRTAKATLETLKRAKTIVQKKDHTNNAKLIDKWRGAAEKASNYLLNAASDKINRTGGKKELVKKEREKLRESIEYSIDSSFQDRIYEITNSEAYETLPEKEQNRILEDLEQQQEKALEDSERTFLEAENDENSDEDDEFTMKDLYKRLKLDYKVVFPDDQ